MNIRNLSNRTLTFKDSTGTIYSTAAYGDLEVPDALWNDHEFRRALRLRIREIEIESIAGGGGGGGGAPDNSRYVVGAADAGLTNELVLGTQVIMQGSLAGRPSPSLAGRLYYVSDPSAPRLTRDTGSSWVDILHSPTLRSGGLDALTGDIDAVARSGVKKNSGSILSTRRNFNFIEGTGVTITITDNSGAESTDITFSGGSFPPGSVMMYAAALAPTGWLLCDGSAVSRSTYSDLFTAISTTYGVGNGSTTFNLPDMRGRVPVGKGTHSDVDNLGDSDGMATVGDRRPTHKHSVSGGLSDPSHRHGIGTAAAGSGNAGAADGGGPGHGNKQTQFAFTGVSLSSLNVGVTSNTPTDTVAYLTLNYIIKT